MGLLKVIFIMHLSFQINFSDTASFLNHWSSRYKYKDDHKYTENIGTPLTQTSLKELFEWKNGIENIAKHKLRSIEDNYPVVYRGDLKSRYLNHRQPGSAIWNIFYLHCLLPSEWPIFDQHVFRAMSYIETGKVTEIPGTNKRKYEAYQSEYRPFLKAFKHAEQRKIDMALFAFGKFLKTAAWYA